MAQQWEGADLELGAGGPQQPLHLRLYNDHQDLYAASYIPSGPFPLLKRMSLAMTHKQGLPICRCVCVCLCVGAAQNLACA